MPRSNIEEQIESGMLTAPSAAELMPVSRTTISNLGRRGIIPRIIAPGIKETRYSAMELMKYCVTNFLPVNPRLSDAAKSYAQRYGQLEEFNKLSEKQPISTVKQEVAQHVE